MIWSEYEHFNFNFINEIWDMNPNKICTNMVLALCSHFQIIILNRFFIETVSIISIRFVSADSIVLQLWEHFK